MGDCTSKNNFHSNPHDINQKAKESNLTPTKVKVSTRNKSNLHKNSHERERN